MSVLSVSMFGRFEIQRDGSTLATSPPRKARELLAYLLLYRRGHPREKLATLLWHEETNQTRAYLRKALWQLRRAFDAEGEATSPVLQSDGDWLQIHPEADLWLDVTVFEDAFAQVRDCPVPAMTADQVESLKRAVDLYAGDLLENWYHDWCLIERERLQDMYLRALDRLARCCEDRGAYETGIQHCLEAHRVDPARERTHRQLMRLRARAGDRTGALRQYERCAEVLEQELGVSPATATQRLHEEILRDEFPASSAGALTASLQGASDRDESSPASEDEITPFGSPSSDDASLQAGLERIRELQSTLAAVQKQIRHDFEAVEVAFEEQS
jgi:DNA-binding SARP family transcriptional activator